MTTLFKYNGVRYRRDPDAPKAKRYTVVTVVPPENDGDEPTLKDGAKFASLAELQAFIGDKEG